MSQMSNLDKFETISVENCFTQIYNYNLIMILSFNYYNYVNKDVRGQHQKMFIQNQ